MSAFWPTEIAIVNVIEADSGLSTRLAGGRVYNMTAPPNSLLPYVVIGDVSESPAATLGFGGYTSEHTLHIWARSKPSMSAIYADLHRLFHGRSIGVANFRHVLGSMRFVTLVIDPDDMTLLHGVASYSSRSLNLAS